MLTLSCGGSTPSSGFSKRRSAMAEPLALATVPSFLNGIHQVSARCLPLRLRGLQHRPANGCISRKSSLPSRALVVSALSTRAEGSSLEEWKESGWNTSSPVVLSNIMSWYNAIAILEVPEDSPSELAGSRLLLLDKTGNVHSIYKKDSKWVGSYWDEFSSLPPIIPEGPIAILGLGGGTAARLMLDLWPERNLEGWEIDEILVDKARMYLGLSDLEVINEHGGGLRVHIGDALSADEDPEGGFAGIIVDLFSNGEVLPVLREPETWFKLKSRLKPGGRIMINCVEEKDSDDEGNGSTQDEHFVLHAMLKAFPDEVSWRRLDHVNNKMALTGTLPDLEEWAEALPERLKEGVYEWKFFY